MQTKTIGQLLKAERELRNVSLSQVAAGLKVKETHLLALENDRFDQLPATPFVKGYIHRYATFLNLDAAPLIALLRRDYKESARGTLVPREFINPMLEKKQRWNKASFMLLGVVTVFLTLTGYVVAQWLSLQRPPFLEVYSPIDGQQVSAQIEVSGKTEADAEVTINAQRVGLQPDGTFQTEIFIPRQGVTTITISAKDSREKTSTIQRTVTVSF